MERQKFNKYLPTILTLFICFPVIVAMTYKGKDKEKILSPSVKISWDEKKQDQELKVIQPGIPAYDGISVIYKGDNKAIVEVDLVDPIIVAVADKPQGWGYFNFPNIYKSVTDKTLVCTWHMAPDAASSYGKGGGDRRISTDGGKTWQISDRNIQGGGLLLPEGGRLSVNTPPAININEIHLPEPIAVVKDGSIYNQKFTLYRYDDLPDTLKGVYISYWNKDGIYSKIHANMDDRSVVRYAVGDIFPIVWWGKDFKISSDGSIVTGIYPAFYENEKGEVDPSVVSFYRSFDKGKSWKIVGKIPYIFDAENDPNGINRKAFGWTEPAFEILEDGTYLCVLRTTDGYGDSPMYISRSSDQGATWTIPKAFTPSGVLPRLLQLENGVLVLASGRPGLQLRFSFDGKGEEWTDPFELILYNKDESSTAATCGYPRLLVTGPDRFLVVYSDFKYPISSGDLRKAIKIREVVVKY